MVDLSKYRRHRYQPQPSKMRVRGFVVCVFVVVLSFALGIFVLNFANNRVHFYLQTPKVEFDQNSNLIVWQPIYRANNYHILVNDIDLGTVPQEHCFVSVAGVAKGTYEVFVRAEGGGNVINSQWSQKCTIVIQNGKNIEMTLEKPKGLFVDNDILHWQVVPFANSYDIKINDMTKRTARNEIDLQYLTQGHYDIKVMAIGNNSINIKEATNMIVNVPAQVQNVHPKSQINKSIGQLQSNIGNPNQIRVRADDGIYFDSEWSDPINYTVTATLPIPTGFKIEDGVLAWNVVPNAIGYEIKMNDTVWPSTTSNDQNIGSLVPGRYEFSVRAVGDEQVYLTSPWSQALLHTVTGQLDQPNDIKVEGDELQWDEVENALYYEIELNGEVQTLTSNSFDMKTLDPGVYSIRIRALGDNHVVVNLIPKK